MIKGETMTAASDFMSKFKSIFGMPEDSDRMEFGIDVETPEKAKLALGKIIIMQKASRADAGHAK